MPSRVRRCLREQDAVLDPDEIEGPRQPSKVEWDHLFPDVGTATGVDTDDQSLLTGGLAADGLREGETIDFQAATEDGMTYVPPIDPPIIPDPDDQEADPIVAAGTSVSALDESYASSATALADESDLTERIREALRADAETSRLADRLAIGVVGSVAVIRGIVDDIDDSDAIVAVAERVPGIDEVRDETEVPGL